MIRSMKTALVAGFAGLVVAAPDEGQQFHHGGATYTPEQIHIDPLGAEQEVAWIVHASDSLTIRSGPGRQFPAIGRLETKAEVKAAYHVVMETDEEWLRLELDEHEQAWISRTGVYRPHPQNTQNIGKHGNLPFGEEIVNRWWALPSDYEPNDLVNIAAPHTSGGGDRKYQLRREAAETLVLMFEAAAADGITLKASSPYRSWATQKQIYDRNIRRQFNQRSSAPPGHSEHQLGTTCDISYARGGFLKKDTPEHNWLSANAADFGWRQTYHDHNVDQTGYIEEPWHWRYVGGGAERKN